MKTNQPPLLIITICALVSFAATGDAATPPYFEDFESYAVGDTMVTNFTEESTLAWTIVSPSFSGQAYENDISVFSPGPGFAAGENSSAAIEFPRLATSTFFMSTSFVIDSLVLQWDDPNNPASMCLAPSASA